MQSVYLNDLNRVIQDVNSLRHYSELGQDKQADVYASYIIDEVKMLVKLVQDKQ